MAAGAQAGFTPVDWTILAAYIGVLAATAWAANRRPPDDARAYFLAGGALPAWLAAVSVLSTSQSAATFLGGPDYGFRGDYAYLASFLGAAAAAWLVGRVLIPRFHAIGATTVYEWLERRYGAASRHAAAVTYLAGRVFAAGARLYMAALAVSMVVFLDVDAPNVIASAGLLLVLGVVFTWAGGLKQVAWSDLAQALLYVGAALAALVHLRLAIPADTATLLSGLAHAPGGIDKLRLFDTSLALDRPFSLAAVFTGVLLLYAASFGLDQETSQRLLACRDARSGARALIGSVLISVPVVWLFITIGQLLHVFYTRPDLMGAVGPSAAGTFQGETITVFMAYILSEMPPGLRGLIVVGIIAAAALNAGLNAMASVALSDLWRPLQAARAARAARAGAPPPPAPDAMAEVRLSRLFMLASGVAVFGFSIVCLYWQRMSDMALLPFALAVMTFAYAGLIGIYAAALFTRRGDNVSAIAALAAGFCAILAMQPWAVAALGLPEAWGRLAFPWQLCAGSALAFLVCVARPGRGGAAPFAGPAANPAA